MPNDIANNMADTINQLEKELKDLREENKVLMQGCEKNDSWLKKELIDTGLTLDMTLEDAYQCIKGSYIQHKSERNAIYLPKAELIALTCIKKVMTENNKRTAEWIECEVYYDKEDLEHKKFKCSNCNAILHDIIGIGELAVEKYCFNCGYAMFGDYNKKEKE